MRRLYVYIIYSREYTLLTCIHNILNIIYCIYTRLYTYYISVYDSTGAGDDAGHKIEFNCEILYATCCRNKIYV